MKKHTYYKKHSNKKLLITIIMIFLFSFSVLFLYYPEINSQINKIQNTLTAQEKILVSIVPDQKAISLQIHSLVNQKRQESGLNPLIWNDGIAEIASSHSKEMSITGDYSHTGLDQRLLKMGCPDGSENIEMIRGYHLDQIPTVAINDWINSYGHRENILNQKFTSEGIGISNDGNIILITEDFC